MGYWEKCQRCFSVSSLNHLLFIYTELYIACPATAPLYVYSPAVCIKEQLINISWGLVSLSLFLCCAVRCAFGVCQKRLRRLKDRKNEMFRDTCLATLAILEKWIANVLCDRCAKSDQIAEPVSYYVFLFLYFFFFFCYSPAALLEFTKEMKKEVLDLNKPWLNCI